MEKHDAMIESVETTGFLSIPNVTQNEIGEAALYPPCCQTLENPTRKQTENVSLTAAEQTVRGLSCLAFCPCMSVRRCNKMVHLKGFILLNTFL